MAFRSGDRIRPVAPFLEVYALTAAGALVPLTTGLLEQNGLTVEALAWQVQVANRKVVRRTGQEDDLVAADTGWFGGHDVQPLDGHCPNFVVGGRACRLRAACASSGRTPTFPEIRLRFTPAKGLIYGPQPAEGEDADPAIPAERAIYDTTKGTWRHFEAEDADETVPPSLFAIVPPAPSWLHDNMAVSRGYFDDACDGIVEVRLDARRKAPLTAVARDLRGAAGGGARLAVRAHPRRRSRAGDRTGRCSTRTSRRR